MYYTGARLIGSITTVLPKSIQLQKKTVAAHGHEFNTLMHTYFLMQLSKLKRRT